MDIWMGSSRRNFPPRIASKSYFCRLYTTINLSGHLDGLAPSWGRSVRTSGWEFWALALYLSGQLDGCYAYDPESYRDVLSVKLKSPTRSEVFCGFDAHQSRMKDPLPRGSWCVPWRMQLSYRWSIRSRISGRRYRQGGILHSVRGISCERFS